MRTTIDVQCGTDDSMDEQKVGDIAFRNQSRCQLWTQHIHRQCAATNKAISKSVSAYCSGMHKMPNRLTNESQLCLLRDIDKSQTFRFRGVEGRVNVGENRKIFTRS